MKSAKSFEGATFSAKLAQFINQNKRTLVIGCIALLLIITGFSLYYGITGNKAEESNLMAEKIQRKYIDWIQESDETQKDTLLEELNETIDSAIRDLPKTYAAQRAYFIRGQLSVYEEKWSEAYEDFNYIAENFPNSYLASVACYNAAASAEMNGEIENAKKSLLYILDNFPLSPEAPQACFNLGRLYELDNNTDNALKYYEMVLSDFSESKWKNLAQDRIIILEIENS